MRTLYGKIYGMSLDTEWYRSEFINHEYLDEHRPLERELSFYEAVVLGDTPVVKKNLQEKDFSNPEGMGVLSDNPIQNLRYHFVVTTAMITRYCVHGGMEQDKAYSLSDFYIQKMDHCKSIEEISKLHDVMCLDFCQKMDALRKTKVLSKPIVLCIDYIYTHLHYRITVEELAEVTTLSPNYLSSLFKKEMGVSLNNYIRNIKIEKSCNLLKFSDYTLSEIANYLAFSSESHFIQSFQKKMGITPNKFRQSHFRSEWEHIGENKDEADI